jgi:dTDP-4-amino-4,6-dideoxygalactose transaminase
MIPYNDLSPIHRMLEEPLQAAVRRVLHSGWFVLGAEGEAFEQEFAAYCGTGHAVGVASGTDAVELTLRATGIGPGDEVITVSHTAVATVCAVELSGARPVLVDVDPKTLTMDPAAAEAAITPRTRAILPVHLYGHPADVVALRRIADAHGLLLIEDAAQAVGATVNGRPVGSFGHIAAVSFYPTKNLGACGDAGAVLTDDPQMAEQVRQMRSYGQETRANSLRRGINSRMDEMQAALLRVKMQYLDEHHLTRRRMAQCYSSQIQGVELPYEAPGVEHAYHLYVVRHPSRDALQAELKSRGIGTAIHYPRPVHLQDAYTDLGFPLGSLPETERAVQEILSLPLYIGLSDDQIERVVAEVNEVASEVPA